MSVYDTATEDGTELDVEHCALCDERVDGDYRLSIRGFGGRMVGSSKDICEDCVEALQ